MSAERLSALGTQAHPTPFRGCRSVYSRAILATLTYAVNGLVKNTAKFRNYHHRLGPLTGRPSSRSIRSLSRASITKKITVSAVK